MQVIKYIFHKGNYISKIDNRLYSSFIEHLGRAVYSGIYEPDHPKADKYGFRTDVAEFIKALHVQSVRYPGGNFVSGYNWRDGIGPLSERPVRLDYAWLTKESNQFGIDEFANWSALNEIEPMIAVNLGTGTPQEAGYFIEYCNFKSGTTLSDLRIKHGRIEPYNFKLWCLGNEMDGPWQTCNMSADDYVKKARETAKIMRWVDSDIELIACGSSNTSIHTYPEWDRIVLEGLYNHVDYLSCHHYYENETDNIQDFLASFVCMDNFIKTIIATADYAKAKARSNKQMMISFDEWNIWSNISEPWDNRFKDKSLRYLPEPPLLEQYYTFLDALTVGGLLCSLINHSDRVKIACLAQLVNVIAPIMTQKNGNVIRQTIYWPLQMVSKYGRGYALNYFADVPMYLSRFGDAKMIQSAVIYNPENKQIVVFALNCDENQYYELDPSFFDFGVIKLNKHIVLKHDDLMAKNSFLQPDKVAPVTINFTGENKDKLVVSLAPLSWNTIIFDVD